ncbi:hypothetical protein C9374_008150 [Naegleria lovaniensis]|uniref:Zn(2)-C6 fungal-type domain-containing protein n=1 Tax=Naegleria lovaniensis TaxID=51637 RepID=A0AA88GJU5_NAELO|nr:uncharacterized protein C9374_008150 [Naegleria lovaniensis]KAG2378511.1 hypothetical protein C9374_008150 [Naegleria lovaniensis]
MPKSKSSSRTSAETTTTTLASNSQSNTSLSSTSDEATSESPPPSQTKQRIVKTPYTKRACVGCHKAKVKCSHERPCHRCTAKGIECVDYIPVQQQQQQQQQANLLNNPSSSLNTTSLITPHNVMTLPAGANPFLFAAHHSNGMAVPMVPVIIPMTAAGSTNCMVGEVNHNNGNGCNASIHNSTNNNNNNQQQQQHFHHHAMLFDPSSVFTNMNMDVSHHAAINSIQHVPTLDSISNGCESSSLHHQPHFLHPSLTSPTPSHHHASSNHQEFNLCSESNTDSLSPFLSFGKGKQNFEPFSVFNTMNNSNHESNTRIEELDHSSSVEFEEDVVDESIVAAHQPELDDSSRQLLPYIPNSLPPPSTNPTNNSDIANIGIKRIETRHYRIEKLYFGQQQNLNE